MPWSDLPLWVPSTDPAFTGFYNINNSKALKDGLTLRPLSQTVSETLAWLKTRPANTKLKVGMDIATETKLLIKYQKEQAS
jgi:2'-hydroxyisoflavone reductase